MNAADRRRLSPALGMVATILLLVLITLWLGVGRGAGWHDHAAPPKLPPTNSVLPAPTVAPLDQYALVWQHPLFSPDRQPQPVAGGDGTAASDLVLTGVIMVPGLRMAIVHDKSRNRDYRLVEGQSSHDGPALVELSARSAVVEAAGGRAQLQLVPAASPEAGKAGPGPAAAQDTSANVTPRNNAGDATAAQAQAAERARALKARIEAERRRAQQHGGG